MRTGPPPGRLFAFVGYVLRPMRGVVVAASLAGVAVALIETSLIWIAGSVIDTLAETAATAGPAALWSLHGGWLLALAALILLVRPAVIFLQMTLVNQGVSINLVALARWRAHRHLLGQSVGVFQNDFAGRIAARVMQTGQAVEDAVYGSIEAILYCVAYIAGSALVLAAADPALMAPLAVWLALYAGLLAWLVPKMGRAAEMTSERRSALTGKIVDAYSNIDAVKLFAHAGREEAEGRAAIEALRAADIVQMRLMTLMSLGLAVAGGVLLVGTAGTAIWLWTSGAATIGAVSAAVALSLRLNSMSGWIMWVTSQLFQHAGVIREGLRTIAQPHEITDAPQAPALRLAGGKIAFRAVSHRYGQASGGLDHVDLTIKAGERVGLVGRSGAGKSTLLKLLLRFHEAEAGVIEIDGQNIAGVTQSSLRAHIGMVSQEAALLHRSVRDNIRYGRPDAPDAEVIAAARRVSADDFIPDLADQAGRRGYDAHVGERGVKLSGGQRQRIALARAVLKDAPILVLDEATSALDSEAEAAIQAAMAELMAGKTVIAIAHRLSTIAAMDRIVVLDAGRIVEQGSHAELLARDGLYASLWARQSGGFLIEEAAVAD
jgi:ATP-binding cassette subfamily B multidrug efflux pump